MNSVPADEALHYRDSEVRSPDFFYRLRMKGMGALAVSQLKALINRDLPDRQSKLTRLKIGIQRPIVFKLAQH